MKLHTFRIENMHVNTGRAFGEFFMFESSHEIECTDEEFEQFKQDMLGCGLSVTEEF